MKDDHYYHPEDWMGRHEDKTEKRYIRPSSQHAKKSRELPGGSEQSTKRYIHESSKDVPAEVLYRKLRHGKEDHCRLSSNIIQDDESRVSSKSNKSSNHKLKSNRLKAIDEYQVNHTETLMYNPLELKDTKTLGHTLNDDEMNLYYHLDEPERKESRRRNRREHEEEEDYHPKERKNKENNNHSKQYKNDREYDIIESYGRKESKKQDYTSKSAYADDHSMLSSKRKGLGFLRIFKRKESEKDDFGDTDRKREEHRSVSGRKKKYDSKHVIEVEDYVHRKKERDVYRVDSKRYIDSNDKSRSRKSKSLGYSDDDYAGSDIRVNNRLSEHKYKPPRERQGHRDRNIQDEYDDDRSPYIFEEEFDRMHIHKQNKKMYHHQEELNNMKETKVKKYPNKYESKEMNRFQDHSGNHDFNERIHKSRDIDGDFKRHYRRRHESMQVDSDTLTDERMRSSVQSLESFSSFENRAHSVPQRRDHEKISVRDTSTNIKMKKSTKMIAETEVHKPLQKRNQPKDEIPKSALSLAVLSEIKKGDVSLKEVSTEEKKVDNHDILSQIRNGTKLNSRPRSLSPKPEKPMTILDEIKKGKQLKKAEPSTKVPNKESNDDTLDGIRARRKRAGNSKTRSSGYCSDEWT
jgi:hypothetical protein